VSLRALQYEEVASLATLGGNRGNDLTVGRGAFSDDDAGRERIPLE